MGVLRHIGRRCWALGLTALASVVVVFAAPGPQYGPLSAGVTVLAAGDGCQMVEEGTFHWIWPAAAANSAPMEWHPAVFLGRTRETDPRDAFVADLRVTAAGQPREIRRLTNLSRTAEADEGVLVAAGDGRVAFAGRVGSRYGSVDLIDFDGEPKALTAGWSRGWRLANGITNFQRTGRFDGVHWRSYVFLEPPSQIQLKFQERERGDLEISLPTGNTLVDHNGETSSPAVMAQEMVKGRPALLAWAVDTVRAIPWVGRRKIEWLEKYWLDFSDWLARARYDVLGEPDTQDAQLKALSTEAVEEPGFTGWPPAPLEPQLKRRIEGEGVWQPVDDGIFTPDVVGPPLFYQTFIRVDRKRPFARVYITAWDPDRVGLGIMAGVIEPLSTTGMRGRGQVPRKSADGDDVSRLVGAFNGAFQALHGEWGMALDRRYFLPPRAYGATVAVYDDGRVAMGTWPHPVGELPPDMKDMRQNVNPLVEKGRLNPYQRVWWGGVPLGLADRVFTVRSGICLTDAGKLAYLWGTHQSPETLGAAMIATGCEYGIHLDMNAGHCGFEYYRIDPLGQQPAPGRELMRKSEVEGLVPQRGDLFFRARKMVPEMSHMRFPRYVGRDPRDFFYLVQKESILDRAASGDDSVEWKPCAVKRGYPVAMVTAGLDDDVRLFKLDLEQVKLSVEDSRPDDALLAVPFSTNAKGITTGLRLDGREMLPLTTGAYGLAFGEKKVSMIRPGEEASGPNVVQGVSHAVAKRFPVRHVLGRGANGYWYVATGGGGPEVLSEAAQRAGAEQLMALLPPGQSSDQPSYWLVVRWSGVAAWMRIFEDTEPVPPAVWRKVFQQRGQLLDRNGH